MADAVDPPPPPSLPPEETPVEFHKPKPVHNWREFLKEYAIIVLGVITALAAEQAVEWMHWQIKVSEARQAILAEMAANNENLYAYRVAIGPCVRRDLNQAAVILNLLEKGQKTDGMQHFSPAPGALSRDSEWQAERASQVLTHFPRSELAVMSRYYAQMQTAEGFTVAEGGAVGELAVLENPPAGMTTTDLIKLRNSLRAAKAFESLVVSYSTRQLRISAQLGVGAPRVDAVRVKNFCTMNQDEFIRWRTTQDLR